MTVQAAIPSTGASPRFDEAVIARALPDAFNVATRILDGWGFTQAEKAVVFDLPLRTFSRYLKHGVKGVPSRDFVERVSLVLGIEKALEIFGTADTAKAWVNNPSFAPLFGGKPPKTLLTTGYTSDLFQVRSYLDGWRGGDFG